MFPIAECIFDCLMKNRLLYSLVGLMVISLVGIIVLQSIWVSKAIEDQEKEFGFLVNNALNDVNDNIDENSWAIQNLIKHGEVIELVAQNSDSIISASWAIASLNQSVIENSNAIINNSWATSASDRNTMRIWDNLG